MKWVINVYDDKREFFISLQFTGIEIVSDVISPYSGNVSRPGFLIPVEYRAGEKESFLLLTTIGDILEYEIVKDLNFCCGGKCIAGYSEKKKVKTEGKEFCPNRLFRDEVYLPQLMQLYDPLSMHVELKNNEVWITYRKN